MGDRTRLILALMLGMIAFSIADGAEVSREILASDVRAMIEAGQPAEFDNCVIVGNLNLSTLKIEGPVHFNRTLFQDLVNFNSTTFNDTAYFSGSDFNGNADFMNSDFNVGADFWGSTFNGTANFGGSDFYYADFWGSTFNSTADFWGSDFNGDANFGVSTFNGDANFGVSTFNGTTFLAVSTFNGTTFLGGSTFNGDAHIGGSVFNGTTFLGYSTFNGDAHFVGSRFNITTFEATQFNKNANFEDARFNGTASFNSSLFKGDALFEGSDFNCTLYLTRTKYDKLYIRWRNIKGLGYDDAAYLSLMENFKKLGYLEDYDNCYYEYRKERRDQNWGGKYHGISSTEEWIRKRIDAGLEIFYGYGKKPLNPIYWSIGTILLFGSIWRIGGLKRDKSRNQKGIFEKYGHGNTHISKKPLQNRNWQSELYILAEAMLFSATVFLSGTRLFIDPPEIPELQDWSKFTTKAAFIAERILGAFFSILFFLAIGATVIR